MARYKKQQTGIPFNSQVSEIQLVYKSHINASERPKISSIADAAQVFRDSWNKDTIELQEELKVIYLNRAHRVLGIYPVSTGTTTGTLVDCRLILAAAIRLNSLYILLAHNHPSGNLSPSKADKLLTRKIKMGAALMDIYLLDHIIITKDDFYSFANEGEL